MVVLMLNIRKNIWYWLTLGTYLLVLGCYFINFTGLQMVTDGPWLSIVLAFILVIILIVLVADAILHEEDMCQDKKYQILFLIINVLFLIVFIRMIWDNNIVSVYLNNVHGDSNGGMRYLFLNENLPIFSILYTMVLGYQITYFKKKDVKKHGRKH